MASLRRGEWRGKTLPALGHDPQSKILGILGMGGIGRNVAQKALAFGMTIRYHNRTRLSESVERECAAEYVSFDRLLAESDVLSLNLPLNVKCLSALLLFGKPLTGRHAKCSQLLVTLSLRRSST